MVLRSDNTGLGLGMAMAVEEAGSLPLTDAGRGTS